MTGSARRHLVGSALPLVCAAGVLAVWLLTTVPDPLATHWNWNGDADGSMSRSAFGVLAALLIGSTGLLASAAVRRSPVERGDLAGPVAITTFLQWVFAGVVTSVLVANTGAADWNAARLPAVSGCVDQPLRCGSRRGRRSASRDRPRRGTAA